MRLEPQEVQAIKAAALKVFGPDCEVRLFGSRADDAKRGGDIDLHVTLPASPDGCISPDYRFEYEISRAIGEQKIDVVVRNRSEPMRLIDRVAIEEGILL